MKEKAAKDVILVDEHANDLAASDHTTGNKPANTPVSHNLKVEESSNAGDKPIYNPMIGAVKHHERKIEKSGDETETNVSKTNNYQQGPQAARNFNIIHENSYIFLSIIFLFGNM